MASSTSPVTEFSSPSPAVGAGAGNGVSEVEMILVQQLKALQFAMAETHRACAHASLQNKKFGALELENSRLVKQLKDNDITPVCAGTGSADGETAGVHKAWVPGAVGDASGLVYPEKVVYDPSSPMLNFAPIMPGQAEDNTSHRAPSISSTEKKEDSSDRGHHSNRVSAHIITHGSEDSEGDHRATTKAAQPKAVFADAAALKEKLRANMSKKPYDVRDLYHKEGFAQRVAKSNLFDHSTLCVIAFNAIWISIDTDYNTADILLDAEPVFIVMENFFCLYFSLEWLFRFLSFRRKRDGLKDMWFVFDSTLVFFMVGETWCMTLLVICLGGGNSSALGNASILRLFRLLRLSRMARMARLLKAMPELLVLIKGMVVAMRSVFFTLCLLAGILYVFGIAFVQLMKDTTAGDAYFGSVPQAMNSLLLQGLLPDEAELVEAVGGDGWVFKVLVLGYIILAGLCVMNMLVGVLCEVVSVVSSVEKESLLVNYVKTTLQHMLITSGIDADGDHKIARSEFETLLELPGAARAIQEVGVDVVGLMDFTDFIFKDGKELSFPDFMDTILQLRGTNTATVKDIVDLRKLVVLELDKLSQKNTENMAQAIEDFCRTTKFGGGGGGPGGGCQVQYTMPPQYANYALIPSQAPPPMSIPNLNLDNASAVSPLCSGISWAASAASRLSAAANELSAAAGELSARQKLKQKLNEPGQYMSLEDNQASSARK
jgi:hypothetical protein